MSDEAELPIMTQALGLWHEVNDQTGGKCGVRTVGVTHLASTPEKLEKHLIWLKMAQQHGLDTVEISESEIANMLSGKSTEKWIGGIQTPSDACGEPWQAVPAVAELARSEGVVIRENCAVRALDITNGQIEGVMTEAGPVRCEQVVLAAGAWSSVFARRHGIDIPQLSVRSTVVQTEPCEEFSASNCLDEKLAWRRRTDGGYTLAVCDGHDHYIGPDSFRHIKPYIPMMIDSWADTYLKLCPPSGFPNSWGLKANWKPEEQSPFEIMRVLEPDANQTFVQHMIDRYNTSFPKVEKVRVKESWAGMIDAMPDVVPVVDRVPALSNLIVATGMSGHGFGIGPGFGRVIARMACEKTKEHDLQRFRFGRFTDGSKLVLGPSL